MFQTTTRIYLYIIFVVHGFNSYLKLLAGKSSIFNQEKRQLRPGFFGKSIQIVRNLSHWLNGWFLLDLVFQLLQINLNQS